MRRFLNIVVTTLFLAIILLAGALYAGPSIPFLDQYEVKIVKSGSMEPTIMTGGIVFIASRDSYQVGDVITFDGGPTAGIPTTHRIIEASGAGSAMTFVTQGDANEDRDTNPVPVSRVRGKVLFDMPYIGYLLDFARKPIGFALLIGLPALLIVIDEIEKIYIEVRRMRGVRTHTGAAAPTEEIPVREILERATRPDPMRPRAMMDIRRPTPRAPLGGGMTVRTATPAREGRGVIYTALSIVLLATMVAGSSMTGSTISYFNDTEQSNANTLAASALDVVATAAAAAYGFRDGIFESPDGGITHDVSPMLGSALPRYSLTVALGTSTPGYCDAIAITVTDPFIYTGSLASLVAPDTPFDGSWTASVSLATTSYPIGSVCAGEFVYRAYRDDVPNDYGYADEERIPFTITMLPPVVGLAAFRTLGVDEETTTEIVIPTTDATTTEQTVDENATNTPTGTEQQSQEPAAVVEILVPTETTEEVVPPIVEEPTPVVDTPPENVTEVPPTTEGL